jgi:lipid-A-disaccharide synthase
VAVLIDFPEFNLRLLKKLKQAGVRIVYYVGPQLWAWRRGRVHIVRRHVDRMAVILPFEEEFYRKQGVEAEFVGHPILEDFSPDYNRQRFLQALGLEPARKTVALLPGSRRQEVEYILPVLLQASLRILQAIQAQFLVSVAPTIETCQISRIASRVLGDNRRACFRLVSARARDALACSDFGLVKSGTSTLEAALVGTPFLITYKISPASWFAGNILIRSHLKGLVNLVAGEEIVPELLQGEATPEALSQTALSYLNSPAKTDAMRSRLAKVREMLGARHASDLVAAMVAGYL